MRHVGGLVQLLILAILGHYRRGRGRRLMVILHLITGTDRDSRVDVWSWRTALALAQVIAAACPR